MGKTGRKAKKAANSPHAAAAAAAASFSESESEEEIAPAVASDKKKRKRDAAAARGPAKYRLAAVRLPIRHYPATD